MENRDHIVEKQLRQHKVGTVHAPGSSSAHSSDATAPELGSFFGAPPVLDLLPPAEHRLPPPPPSQALSLAPPPLFRRAWWRASGGT